MFGGDAEYTLNLYKPVVSAVTPQQLGLAYREGYDGRLRLYWHNGQ